MGAAALSQAARAARRDLVAVAKALTMWEPIDGAQRRRAKSAPCPVTHSDVSHKHQVAAHHGNWRCTKCGRVAEALRDPTWLEPCVGHDQAAALAAGAAACIGHRIVAVNETTPARVPRAL